jgi:hypothetical protein
VSDLIDMRAVKVIALKKCGSSMLHRAFSELMFDPKAHEPNRLVVFVRHPAARAVSAYNHFIIRHNAGEAFGPRKSFEVWLQWLLDHDPNTLDHHLRPQSLELWDRFQAQPVSHLFLCVLEKSVDALDDLTEFMGGHQPDIKTDIRHPHPPWPLYFAERNDLLEAIRKHFANDMALWMSLVQSGGHVVLRDVNLRREFDWLSN